MKDQGVGRAQLKTPTLQPRTENRQVRVSGLQTGDNSTEATYLYDCRLPSSFEKMEMALEDAKRLLEQEKMLIPDVREEEDTNPDPVVRYAIVDETNKASRNKKKSKKKSDKDDRLVDAIKRALSEENSVTDDSYTQFSRNASSLYTDDELINFASSTISGSSYTEDSYGRDYKDITLNATSSGFTGATSSSAMSGSFTDDCQKPLEGRRHSRREDELDESTMLSGCTEYTTMTSSVTADFQSPFMCTSSRKKKQGRTQRRDRGRTDSSSVFSEPDYLEDEDAYYDDDISHDNTYSTRGTVGVVQDILSCGTYSLCFESSKKYQPEEDSVSSKETRRTEDSRVTPLTVKERLSRARSKKSLEDDGTEVTVKRVNTKEDAIFQEQDAKIVTETLENIFWEGDGVFSDESSNAAGLTPVGSQSEAKETSEMGNYDVVWKGDDATVLLSTSVQSNSLQKTDQIVAKLKSNQKSLPATSDISIASSTKKKKPYLLSAARSFGKSISFRKQKSSATQQLQKEIDVDVASDQEQDNIGTVQDTEPQNLQRGRTTTSQSSQGYEMPRKKSFRQMMRSRSKKRTLKHPISPARTVDASLSTDSTSTDPELSAITANEWRSAKDYSTGKTYFYNKRTKEVRWEAPDGFEEEKSSSPIWKDAYDTTTGRTYYYNRKTKEVAWTKPYDLVTN